MKHPKLQGAPAGWFSYYPPRLIWLLHQLRPGGTRVELWKWKADDVFLFAEQWFWSYDTAGIMWYLMGQIVVQLHPFAKTWQQILYRNSCWGRWCGTQDQIMSILISLVVCKKHPICLGIVGQVLWFSEMTVGYNHNSESYGLKYVTWNSYITIWGIPTT